MLKMISAKIDHTLVEKKKKEGVSWPFLIGKGMLHMEQCVPRMEAIQESYNHSQKAKRYARLAYWLKSKHPAIYDEFITTDESLS